MRKRINRLLVGAYTLATLFASSVAAAQLVLTARPARPLMPVSRCTAPWRTI